MGKVRLHFFRILYALVAAYMREGDQFLDAAYGCGLGTFILDNAKARVIGIDKDLHALTTLKPHIIMR